MTVTFFGHRDAPDIVSAALKSVLLELIEERGADHFYVGDSGAFDFMVYQVLDQLKIDHPNISCTVVLAYMPRAKWISIQHISDSILPEEVALAHPKYAICRRNTWMINKSDVVVTYVRRGYGGAARFRKIALNKGKEIIDL